MFPTTICPVDRKSTRQLQSPVHLVCRLLLEKKNQTGLDDVVATSLPTASGAGLALVDQLEPLTDKTVLIVGAGGGVGSFATQLAANAGANVIANVGADDARRMR